MADESKQPAPFDFGAVRWAYFGLVIGMFTASISLTIVGPAIPRIVADLGGLEYYSWLSTIVMLVSAVITPISGKLSDMFGRRRFYILGLVVFMLGSVLSGLAMNFGFLIFARTVQGIGMGILMPLSQTILGAIIPARQRGKYQGYMGAIMGASQVAGPLVGGWVTDVASWRWLFYISLPVGLAALVIILKHLRIDEELASSRKIDHLGITTMTVGVTGVLLGLSLGGTMGWLDPQVLALLVVGAVFIAIFLWVEAHAEEPIVPLHLFRNSIFTFSTLSAFFMNMAFTVLLIYTPVYVQGVLGRSATTSGVILIPMNVVLFVIGIVIGNLTSRTGRYKGFMATGAVVMLGGALLMTLLGRETPEWQIVAITGLYGLGYGITYQLYVLATQNALQRRDLGVGTSALQFFRNIGNTLGTAVAGTIMTTRLAGGIEARMTPEIAAQLPAGGIDPNSVLNPAALARLPEPVAEMLRAALGDAMGHVFLVMPFMAAMTLVFTLCIRGIPLRDTLADPEERGRELLDSHAMSSPEDRMFLSPEESHARAKERILGAHLVLLAEQVTDLNPILRDAVAEFGGGDVDRGRQLLRSAGTMLLTEDPAVIDEHEAFAVELSKRGQQRRMLSTDLTSRLDEVAERVAERPTDVPTKPRIDTADGIDGRAIRRAVGMLDSAYVADLATRRFLD